MVFADFPMMSNNRRGFTTRYFFRRFVCAGDDAHGFSDETFLIRLSVTILNGLCRLPSEKLVTRHRARCDGFRLTDAHFCVPNRRVFLSP